MASPKVSGKDERAFLKKLRNVIFDEAMIWSDSDSTIQAALAFQKSLPGAELLENTYREWGSAFIAKLSGGGYSATFNALHQMNAKGVNVAYVVYHVFNFVYGDLDKPVTLATLSKFHQCRVDSLASLKHLIDHEKILGQSLNQETLIKGDNPLARSERFKQEKKDLLHLIKDATHAMKELYAFELGGSQHEDADTVRSRFLEARLLRLLPRNIKKPWLPQLATLMNTAAEIIVEKKWLTNTTEKVYNEASLGTRMRNAKPIDDIVERIRAQHAGFAAKILNGSPAAAMDQLRRSRVFKPSATADAIIKVAKGWRSSR